MRRFGLGACTFISIVALFLASGCTPEQVGQTAISTDDGRVYLHLVRCDSSSPVLRVSLLDDMSRQDYASWLVSSADVPVVSWPLQGGPPVGGVTVEKPLEAQLAAGTSLELLGLDDGSAKGTSPLLSLIHI